jgi:hypothetical protein
MPHGDKLEITDVRPLSSLALCRYIQSRCVPITIAEQYAKQVHYKVGEREYYGVGIQNNSGGWDIRSPFAKAASRPKDVTFIDNQVGHVIIVEGQFELYTSLSLHQQNLNAYDYLVLNSVTQYNNSLRFLEGKKAITGLLNLDKAGRTADAKYKAAFGDLYTDKSDLYQGYNDLNEWRRNFGRVPRERRKGLSI